MIVKPIFNPHWLNEARVAYYRSYFLFGTTLPGVDIDKMAGIQGFETTSSIRSFPRVNISGYAAFVSSPSDQRPKQNRIRDWQYHGGVNYTTGKHDIKFGFELFHIAIRLSRHLRQQDLWFRRNYSGTAWPISCSAPTA